MNKKFLLFIFCFVFVFQPLTAEENQPEKIHLFSLKCNSSDVPWVFEPDSTFYLDVFTDEKLPINTADVYLSSTINIDVEVHTEFRYRSSNNGLVYWNKGESIKKLLMGATEYEILFGYHHMTPFENNYRRYYEWYTNHQFNLHSISIDRTSLVINWKFDKCTDEVCGSIHLWEYNIDPFTEFVYYESQCSIAAEGDGVKWEKEINDPLRKLWKKENQELLEEIREKRKI